MPTTVTRTYTVYHFDELLEAEKAGTVTQKAVDAARQWLQEGQTEHGWWEFCYKDWTDMLEAAGFADPTIRFSGFYSQGDGASFTAPSVDLPKLIRFLADPPAEATDLDSHPAGVLVKKVGGLNPAPQFARLLWVADHLEAAVERTTHHYSHERTCRFELTYAFDLWNSPKQFVRLSALCNEFEKAAESLRLAACRAIYGDLETEFDYLTADEQLAESSRANGYTFTAAGKYEPL